MTGSDVLDTEIFARWVYKPRFMDGNNFNDRFISLRSWPGKSPEQGVSGQLLNRAGHEQVIACGRRFRRASKDGTANEERFVGYASASVGKIRDVSDSPDDKVDVILTETQDIPFHSEIIFNIDNQWIDGNHLSARFLKYKDKLSNLFAQNLCTI